MGSSYSSYQYNNDVPTGAGMTRRWGDTEASMIYWKEDNGNTEVWRVKYANRQNEKRTCVLEIKATGDYEYNGVESVDFKVTDSSAENKTELALRITRAARDGFSGGITSFNSSSGAAPVSFTYPGVLKQTVTFVLYGCSQRDGEFIFETTTKLLNQNFHRVTLHHYYVNKDAGLYVKTKISRYSVEVEGPFNLPSVHSRWIRGLRPPHTICSRNDNEASNGEDSTLGQVVKQPIFSNQPHNYYKGLINNSNGTTGPLSGSIFINCNLKDFPNQFESIE